MKLIVNVEADYAASESTEIEVPDDATNEQISEIIKELGKEGKLNNPSYMDSVQMSAILQVFPVGEDGEADLDHPIDDCEENW